MKSDINIEKGRVIKLLSYLRKRIGSLLIVIIIAIIESILVMILPIGFGKIVDLMTVNEQLVKIFSFVGIIVGSILLKSIVAYFGELIYSKLTSQILAEIRYDMFSHLLKLPLKYMTNNNKGAFLTRILNDVSSIQDITTGALLSFVTDIIQIIVVLVILFIYSWQLTLISILIMIGYIFISRLRNSIRDMTVVIRKKIEDITTYIEETLSGFSVIKMFVAEDYHNNKFKQHLSQWYETLIKITKKSIIAKQLIGIVTSCGPILILCVGIVFVRDDLLTIGELFAFNSLISRLYAPIANLANFSIRIQNSIVSLNRIFEFMEIEPEISLSIGDNLEQDALDNSRCDFIGYIRLSDVCFSYDSKIKVLEHVNMEIKPGQKIGLVGKSGSGKSTIAKLLLGLYEVNNGDIYYDKTNIKSIDLSRIRKNVSIVSQDIFLFNDTVRENIKYGNWDASEEEILKAARAAHVDEFVAELANGYDTYVGERGERLSLGQRQRISIARALNSKAKILIFDEATSSLDTYNEEFIKESINVLSNVKSCIIISHKLSTVKDCDLIYLIDGGKVLESGSHEELLNQKAYYWEMFAKVN